MAEWSESKLPYPIQVSKWLKEQSDCDSIMDALFKQHVSCAIYKRDILGKIHYSVFRARHEGDPDDIEYQGKRKLDLVVEKMASGPGQKSSLLEEVGWLDINISEIYEFMKAAMTYRDWAEVGRYAYLLDEYSKRKTKCLEIIEQNHATELAIIAMERKEVAA